MIEKAGENPNDMTHISDSITGQDMTIADWKKFKQIYEDSKEYYQNLDDKYVYGFTAKLQTYVKFNEEANRYDRDTLLTEKVVNKYQMEGLTKDLFASCNNFWRNAMVAVAKPGDVVLFKTDSSANISAEDLNEDTVLDQPVPGAEFQVYAKDSDTPLTFTKENDGRYKLDTNSEVTNLPTDEYGQLIVTGLKDGGEYYFKEVKAPAGYELNAEPIAFTISNTEIRYVLAKNDLKATYTVTYEYEGTVPENAPALPEGSTNYQGDKITVALLLQKNQRLMAIRSLAGQWNLLVVWKSPTEALQCQKETSCSWERGSEILKEPSLSRQRISPFIWVVTTGTKPLLVAKETLH